jgi:ech hydrogenase subunit D
MLTSVTEITTDQLLGQVQHLEYEGYRFVTASSVDNGDGSFTLLYHFDRDDALCHLRLQVAQGQSVPSISRIFFCAVLVENEISELFGVPVTDMVIDYGGRLLLAAGAPTTPMACRGGTLEIERK